MKLAIIGAGNVGGTLGLAWAEKVGHEIFFGVRDPAADKTQALVRKLGNKARAGTAAQAAAFGDMIVLTTPWTAAEAANALRATFAAGLSSMRPTRWLWGRTAHSTSAGEMVQKWAEGASPP
jgi:8-hydroxy-5-deazaflavin:NADPH oxidoreductase